MEGEKRITTIERRHFVGTNYRLSKYSYIVVRSMTDEKDALVRKITPEQKRFAILYYVKIHSMKRFKVSFLAKKLGCNIRIIRHDLSFFEKSSLQKNPMR